MKRKHCIAAAKNALSIQITLALTVASLLSGLGITPVLANTDTEGNAETVFLCGIEEHIHSEDCWSEILNCSIQTAESAAQESDAQSAQEEQEIHNHSEECFEQILICTKQEHTHSQDCLIQADSSDDETAETDEKTEEADWKKELEALNLNGSYAQNLAAVAASQIGYQPENDSSRYEEWYGKTMEQWNPLFLRFCLNYAGIPDDKFPANVDIQKWITELEKAENLRTDLDALERGDIVFFESEEAQELLCGVVTGNSNTEWKVTAGNIEGQVKEIGFEKKNSKLLSFTRIEEPEDETEEEEEAGIPASQEEKGLLRVNGSLLDRIDGLSVMIASHNRQYAMTSTLLSSSNGTKGLQGGGFTAANQIWRLDATNAGSSQYKISTLVDSKQKYLYATHYKDNNYHFSLTDTLSDASVFTIADAGNGYLNISTTVNGKKVYLNGYDGGTKFAGWTTNNDDSKVRIYAPIDPNDLITKDVETPSNAVINIFDYWAADNRTDSDIANGFLAKGINVDENGALRNLLFSRNASGHSDKMNNYTGSSAVYRNMTDLTLTDGFPTLSSAHGGDSLAYLFDPNIEVDGKASFSNVGKMLHKDDKGYYVYDSTQRYSVLQENPNGISEFVQYSIPAGYHGSLNGQFFPFNSLEEALEYGDAGSDFNHFFGMNLTTRFIQRYSGYTNSQALQNKDKNQQTVFEFSGDDDVWIFIDDVLVADLGGIHGAAQVNINFVTGDVTVNGTKQTDLKSAFEAAGAYDENRFNKNTFADNTTHTLRFFYLERGNYASNLSLKYNLSEIPATSIFKVDQFGDVVPGAGFAIYATEVDKEENTAINGLDDRVYRYITQTGEKVQIEEGDTVSVDPDSGVITLSKNGTTHLISPKMGPFYTNSNGEILFTDGDQMPLSLEEIVAVIGSPNCILREVKVPDGYRVAAAFGEIKLEFTHDRIICTNTYESASWSSTHALVTAPNVLYKTTLNGTKYETINYYDVSSATATGTLFAVAVKRNGEDTGSAAQISLWHPVSGDELSGFKVWNAADVGASSWNEETAKKAAIQAAQSYGSAHVFTPSPSGMSLTFEQLPGDQDLYHSYTGDYSSKVEYDVIYYHSTASSLEQATTANTTRVWSREIPNNQGGFIPFSIIWGGSIQVPNMENNLYFQKVEEEESQHYGEDDSSFLENAVFALYPAGEDSQSQMYYLTENGLRAYLQADSINPNIGSAVIKQANGDVVGTGTYFIQKVDLSSESDATITSGLVAKPNAGAIEITLSTSETFRVLPVKNGLNESMVGWTHQQCDRLDVLSAGHFHRLLLGNYILREITAPAGYQINAGETKVIVDKAGVFAHAGTADDGIDVGNGAGYLASTMDVFASDDTINSSLRWIQGILAVNTEDTFASLTGSKTNWQYAAQTDANCTEGYGNTYVSTKDEAMVTYLTYDKHKGADERKLFSFTPIHNRILNGTEANGENTYMLFTKEGWSSLIVMQDYAYGKTQTKSSSNYVNLYEETIRSTKGNILYLFSGSTFVIVTNKKAADITLQKYSDQSGEDGLLPLENAQFMLYTDTEDPSQVKYYNGSTFVSAQDETDFSLTTDAQGILNLHNLPEGRYILKETAAPLTSNGRYGLVDPMTIVVGEQTVNGKSTFVTIDGSIPEAGEESSLNSRYQYELELIDVFYRDVPVLKVDGRDRSALEGAQFILMSSQNGKRSYYTVDDDGLPIWKENRDEALVLSSDEMGLLPQLYLSDGTYWLKEVHSPEGFMLIDDELEFSVVNGVIQEPDSLYMYLSNPEVQDGYRDDDHLTIINSVSFVLPETGFFNWKGIYWIGSALILGGAAVYVYVRRKKEAGKHPVN